MKEVPEAMDIFTLAGEAISDTLMYMEINKSDPYIALLLYLHKKVCEIHIKSAKGWIEQQKKTWAKDVEFPGTMFTIKRAEKIIEMIDEQKVSFLKIKEIMEKLEKENVFEKILEIINK
jgi:hypothetical protein